MTQRPDREDLTQLVAIALAVTLLGGVCSEDARAKRGGVRLNDGRLEVLAVTCADDVIADVTVYDPEGQVVGDGDDRILWRIEAQQGSAELVVTIPQAPEGYVETVPLRGEVPGNAVIDVNTRESDRGVFLPLENAELREDTWYNSELFPRMTREEIEAARDRYCGYA